MANRCSVGLVFESAELSLSELSAILGREPPSGSHEKGEPRGLPGRGLAWERSQWREDAPDANAPLLVQCESLLAGLPAGWMKLHHSSSEDVSAWLDIAVFFTSAYFSVTLPRSLLGEINARGVDLEITGYPCSEELEAIDV